MNPDAPRPVPLEAKLAIILVIASVAVFWPGLAGDFIYDDLVDIRTIDAVFKPGGWAELFTTASAQLSRPVKYLSYYIDNQMFGWRPQGWHGQSFAWHALCSVLVFWFALRLGASKGGAFIGGLWFAIHPIHAEAVVWISSRASLQSTAGLLMMIIGYDRWRTHATKQNLALMLGGGLIGFFGKEDALMIFPLILAYEHYIRNTRPSEMLKNKEALRAVVPLAVIAGIYLFLRQTILTGVAQGSRDGGVAGWLATQPVILATYIWQMIWPDPMCIDQHVDYAAGFGAAFWGSCLLLGALGGVLLARRPAWGRWQFAAALFFVTLIPVLGIVPINQPRADRFVYLPSVAGALALAWVADFPSVRGRMRPLALGLGAAALVFYSWRSWDYSKTFLNERTLWENVLTINPRSYRGWANMAAMNNNSGKADIALQQVERSLQIRPEYPEGWVIKAFALQQLGRVKEAEELYRKALAAVPDEPRWLFLLAEVVQLDGRMDEAEKIYDRLFGVRPGYVDARISAGALAIQMKNARKAREHWETALRYEPGNSSAQHNLRVLERSGAQAR